MRIPLLSKALSITVSFALIISIISCKKKAVVVNAVAVPVVTTTNVIINLTSTTATSGGTITSISDAAITANGVCYSTTDQTPTLSDSKTTDSINTTGYAFVSNLTALSPNTKYYLRAYATNSTGTGYGTVVTFTTASGLHGVSGSVTTVGGSGVNGYLDGPAASAEFNSPEGVVADAFGNLFISDTYNNRIREISAAGAVSTFAGTGTNGYADGNASSAQFYGPQGLVIDGQGNLYVADAGNNVIRKITPAGVVSTFAGTGVSGYADGAATTAKFNSPTGLAFDAQGNLYVADRANNIIRKITNSGFVSTVSGTISAGYVNGTAGLTSSFSGPNGVAVDAQGNIYVADLGNNAIREISAGGIVTTVAGGPTQIADVGYPSGMTIDPQGNLYITDESGRILQLTASKVLYILAGDANFKYYADGAGTSAFFNTPQGICIDNKGALYIADYNNNRIRKIIVTTN